MVSPSSMVLASFTIPASWDFEGPIFASLSMNRQRPVHEIQLGSVRAAIWEDRFFDGPRYRVSLSRVPRDGEASSRFDRFEADDLAVVAEIVDLAHLWICEQAELIA